MSIPSTSSAPTLPVYGRTPVACEGENEWARDQELVMADTLSFPFSRLLNEKGQGDFFQ